MFSTSLLQAVQTHLGRAVGMMALLFAVLGGGPAAAQQPSAPGHSPASIPYYLQHPDVELPAALTDRLSDRAVESLREKRAELRSSEGQNVSPSLSKARQTPVPSSQSWALANNPIPSLNFDLTGTPQYAGDVDGDGTNDYLYATCCARDETTSQLEDQTGKTALFFGGTPSQSVDQTLYEELIPVGDLNGDGFDDALAEEPEQEQYRVYTGSESGYQETSTTIDTRGRLHGFFDLDGDGYEDVVIGEYGVTEGFRVVYGASSLGSIEVRQYSQPLYRGDFNVADLDNDGTVSLVRTDGEDIQILETEGDRSLAEVHRFTAERLQQFNSDYLSLIDVTGNGRREIAAKADGKLYLYSADENGTYASTPDSLMGQNLVPVGDLDGDGNHDFYMTDSTGTQYVAYGPDDLSQGLNVKTAIPHAADVSGRLESLYEEYRLGDVTGDDRVDLVLDYQNDVNDQVGRRFFSVKSDRTARSPTNVTYAWNRFFDATSETEEIDFNDDGVLDVAMTRPALDRVDVYYGGSSVSQSPDLTLSVSDTTNPRSLSSGDINGDGAPDLVVGTQDGHRVDVFYGGTSPDATVDHTIFAKDLSIEEIQYPRVVGDVNNDGVDDILATPDTDAPQNLPLFYGGTSPSSTPDATIQYTEGQDAGRFSAALGDVNGDGIDDFAVGRINRNEVEVYFGADSPSFDSPDLTLNNPGSGTILYGYGITAGDFNGDGVNDIATKPSYSFGGEIGISVYHGGTSMDATVDQSLEIPSRAFELDEVTSQFGPLAAVPDVDGDGADELTLGSDFEGTNAVLYRPTQSPSPSLVLGAPNQDAQLGGFAHDNLAVGDVTGDGTVDLVLPQTSDDNDAASSSRIYRYEVGPAQLPPSAPADLQARADQANAEITVKWDSVEAGDLEGYNVYRSTSSFSDLAAATKLNSSVVTDTQFVDGTATRGALYHYRVTAVDTEGNESSISDEVQAPLLPRTVGFHRSAAGLTGVEHSASAVADVNRDGHPDILITGEDAGGEPNTTLYLGNEDGSYTPASTSLPNLTEGSVSFGDTNEDGIPDLILTGKNSNGTRQTEYYLGNGDGTFEGRYASKDGSSYTEFPDFSNSSTSIADVNGDGHLDLLFTGTKKIDYFSDPEPETVLYFGDGEGNFERMNASLADVTQGSSSMADVDGNGVKDILITGETSDGTATTALYLGNPDSTFTKANASLEDVRFSSTAIADVDGDGHQDLLITGDDSNFRPTTSLYLGDGTGGFNETSTDLPAVSGSAIALAKVNGDDTPDLLMTGDADAQDSGESGLSARFYLGDGDGTFTRTHAGMTGVEIGSVTMDDADGDGDRDLLVTGRDALQGAPSARLYVNRSLQRGMNRAPQFAQAFGGGRALLAGQSRTHLVEAGDPDGDSVAVRSPTPDVTVADSGNGVASLTFAPDPNSAGQTVNVRVEAQDARGATGSFTAPVEVSSLVLNPFSAGLTGVAHSTSSMGDVNGDGNQDVLITGEVVVSENEDTTDTTAPSTALYLGNGDGTFDAAGADLVDVQNGATSMGDVNDDGNPDLLITGSDANFNEVTTLYLGNDDGTFDKANASLTDVSSGATAMADLNEDGNLDILLAGSDSNNEDVLTLYLGNGDGTFDEANANLTPGANRSISIADVDTDGHLDVLLTGSVDFEKTTTLYLGNGDGTFNETTTSLAGVSLGETSIADVNEDGHPDILLTGWTGTEPRSILYFGNGDGTFVEANVSLTDLEDGAASIVDINEDGTRDLIITGENANRTPTMKLYVGDGEGGFQEVSGLVGTSGGSMSLGDVDGDNDTDLLLTGEDENNTRIATLYENRTDRNPPETAISNTVTADGEVSFGETGTSLNFSGVSGSGSVTVSRYSGTPSDTSGIDAENVSNARVTIETSGDLSFDSTKVALAVSRFNGINDPTNVTIYKRDTPDSGTFAALETRVGDNNTPSDVSDDTLYATTKSFSEFALGSDTEPLPVEIASLDATVDGEEVALSWTTASETGNAGFRVQRKGKGAKGREGAWTTIGSVNGAGTTSQAQSYRYTDADLPYEADALTYRLKQVDTDGSANYSKTITVERGVSEVQLLGTYPNPARSQATIRYALPEKQRVTVRLYDVLGRRVRTVVNSPKEGRHEQRLDVSRLSSGVYFLRLKADGETRTQKLTVVR